MNLNQNLKQSIADFKTLRTKLLEELPELLSDPECLLDTLDGVTDTKEQLAELVRSAVMDEALYDGLKSHLERLASRAGMLKDRARKKRTVALNHMLDLGIDKITTPDMTISKRNVPPSVVIINKDLIPDNYCRIYKEPDKIALKQVLKGGHIVPGAIMGNGSTTLSVKI